MNESHPSSKPHSHTNSVTSNTFSRISQFLSLGVTQKLSQRDALPQNSQVEKSQEVDGDTSVLQLLASHQNNEKLHSPAENYLQKHKKYKFSLSPAEDKLSNASLKLASPQNQSKGAIQQEENEGEMFAKDIQRRHKRGARKTGKTEVNIRPPPIQPGDLLKVTKNIAWDEENGDNAEIKQEEDIEGQNQKPSQPETVSALLSLRQSVVQGNHYQQEHWEAQGDDDPNAVGPLRLNTIDPFQILSISSPNLINEVTQENLELADKSPPPLNEGGWFKFNKHTNPLLVSNQKSVLAQSQQPEDETNNLPLRIKGQEAKAKATELYTRAEKEIRKYDISIDQFKQRQWVKNPIAGWNLIMISLIYLTIIVVAVPMSIFGIEAKSCNLELHVSYHVYFIFIAMVALAPTDLYAYVHHRRILNILSQQSPLYQPPIQARELTFCSLFGHLAVFMINLLCSACQLYELYSDILIALVSLFNSLSGAFGFFAVILPVINRLIQLYACVKMFIYGLKMSVKTIGTEKVDKLLIYLSLYNMSRLMFPHFHEHKQRWLTIIIVKECAFKLLQITLKLVLITPTLSDDCSGNVTILSLMIMGNLLSAIQMVFYATQKYPKKQEEVEYQNLQELNPYYDPATHSFNAIIVNGNQDMIQKKINAFVFQPRFVTRTINISFQNLSPLIQPRYRDNFFNMLSKYQQFNFKLRELRIGECLLNYTDFKNISKIISQVPKLENLALDNILIKSIEGEQECISQLKYGIERNKNFKNLILRFRTQNKAKLFENFSSMYNLNQQLSIQFVNQFIPFPKKRSISKYKADAQSASASHQHQSTFDHIINVEPGQEESINYSLYDDLDLNFFVESRKADKNHKLFVFRDWENLLRRLYLVKSKNLSLSDMPSLALNRQTLFFKRQIEMFIFWIQYLIQKNSQLQTLSLRLASEDLKLDSPNKLQISLPQAQTIVEEILENESNSIQTATIIHNSFEILLEGACFDQLFEKVLKLNLITCLNLENIKLNPLNFFTQIGKNLPLLTQLAMANNDIDNLDGIQCVSSLNIMSCTKNKIFIDDQDVFEFLMMHLDFLEISKQHLTEEACAFDFQSLNLENQKQGLVEYKSVMISLQGTYMTDDHLCRFVLEMGYSMPHLLRMNLEDNFLTDLSLPFLEKYLNCRSNPLQMLNLSKNKFTTRASRLLKPQKLSMLTIQENYIAVEIFFRSAGGLIITDDGVLVMLQLSKQYQLPKKTAHEGSKKADSVVETAEKSFFKIDQMKQSDETRLPNSLKGNQLAMIDLKPFKLLSYLEIAHIGLEEFPIQLMIQQFLINKTPIAHLDLSGNNVGYNGCKSLNILAQRNKSLKSLRLDSSNIRCIGLSYLWLAYSDQDDDLKLEYLSVQNNGIDVGWAKRLNYKLCQPIKAKHIDLSNNKLNDKATKDLTTYFDSNKHIEILNLSHNGMTREGLRHVKEIVYRNAYIKELIVKGNQDIDESIEMCERRARASETSQKITYY
ncbi:hypothetical protein FGO68_gene4521 [Halteria grandinella]|uniref:Uncharacterized protein n=1 Tax=Halteria grandinella TaxID=5974 RepID=A0A8J8P8W9_HALGN|nr:hypothetical protein FGO68_gene4521 [Halteria grandinella]